MNYQTTPTFRHYLAAWCAGWLTLSSAALCATALVWNWSALSEGFNLWAVPSAFGLTSDSLVSQSVVYGVALLVCALICTGLQFVTWKAIDTFAPRATDKRPLILSSGIGAMIGLACLLLLAAIYGLKAEGQYLEAPSAGYLLIFCLPTAGAAVAAGYGCALQRSAASQRKWHGCLWTAFAGFVVAALYVAGAGIPRFFADNWAGSIDANRSVSLLLAKRSRGILGRWGNGDRVVSDSRIDWKRKGRALVLTSRSSSQVIATGIVSKDAQTLSLHLANPSETTTLTRSGAPSSSAWDD